MIDDRVVLAGGTGFLGRALSSGLHARGSTVVVLTRTPDGRRGANGEQFLHWDGKTVDDWALAVDGARAVINLCGKNVNCRYTPENRAEIVESRENSVRAVAEAIRVAKSPPRVLVQAASLAIYGDTGAEECDENAPPGAGFSPDTCVAWERAFEAAATPATRRVLFRIGFVLGPDGGALEMLARLTRWFLGGTVGSGQQYISWLHLRDMTRAVLWALDEPSSSGVYNVTGPNPVTNAAFMSALRTALGRPFSPPTPAFAVHIGAWLMGTEPSLALTGRRCIPRRLTEQGFRFELPELDAALSEIFGARRA